MSNICFIRFYAAAAVLSSDTDEKVLTVWMRDIT